MMVLHTLASRAHAGFASEAGHRDAAVFDPLVDGRLTPVAGLAGVIVALIAGVAEHIRAAGAALAREAGRRRVLADLADRDDRMLADMGLDRTMIGAVAAGRVRRPLDPANQNAAPPRAA